MEGVISLSLLCMMRHSCLEVECLPGQVPVTVLHVVWDGVRSAVVAAAEAQIWLVRDTVNCLALREGQIEESIEEMGHFVLCPMKLHTLMNLRHQKIQRYQKKTTKNKQNKSKNNVMGQGRDYSH